MQVIRHLGGAGAQILSVIQRMPIMIETRFIDARFLYQQGLPLTRRERALACSMLAWERLRHVMRSERQDLLFERYSRLHTLHYGPKGRGYSTVAIAKPDERLKRYRGQTSRLEHFVDNYPELVRFRDGNSYLDLGCGTGQNIRMLAERYPSSRIVGYDINSDAVGLIRECESHPGVVVDIGDLADDTVLDDAKAEGFDHIILSHVFSLVFESSLVSTIALRRRILSDLAQACRFSLIVIDAFGAVGNPSIKIEQKQRAIVSDDVLGYFAEIDGGRAFMIQSNRSRAVVFVKDDKVRADS